MTNNELKTICFIARRILVNRGITKTLEWTKVSIKPVFNRTAEALDYFDSVYVEVDDTENVWTLNTDLNNFYDRGNNARTAWRLADEFSIGEASDKEPVFELVGTMYEQYVNKEGPFKVDAMASQSPCESVCEEVVDTYQECVETPYTQSYGPCGAFDAMANAVVEAETIIEQQAIAEAEVVWENAMMVVAAMSMVSEVVVAEGNVHTPSVVVVDKMKVIAKAADYLSKFGYQWEGTTLVEVRECEDGRWILLTAKHQGPLAGASEVQDLANPRKAWRLIKEAVEQLIRNAKQEPKPLPKKVKKVKAPVEQPVSHSESVVVEPVVAQQECVETLPTASESPSCEDAWVVPVRYVDVPVADSSPVLECDELLADIKEGVYGDDAEMLRELVLSEELHLKVHGGEHYMLLLNILKGNGLVMPEPKAVVPTEDYGYYYSGYEEDAPF